MSPPDNEDDSGVFRIDEDQQPSLQDRLGWNPAMVIERNRLIRRAIEDEFQRLSEDPEGAERLALAVFNPNQKQFLLALGETVRWDVLMGRINRLQQAANVPHELRLEGELWAISDLLGEVRHAWLTGRLQRRIEERRRLAPLIAKATYSREELCSCSDPRSHAGSRKDILIFEELRYRTLIKPAALSKAA